MWKDVIHLNNVGNNILARIFISFVNEFVLTKSNSFWLKELSAQCSEPSTKNIDQLREADVDSLTKLRIKSISRLHIRTLYISSVSFKFDQLKCVLQGKVDTLVLTESKLDYSFPTNQFLIKGHSNHFRFDRNGNAGGILLYIREDIPCKELKLNRHPHDI